MRLSSLLPLLRLPFVLWPAAWVWSQVTGWTHTRLSPFAQGMVSWAGAVLVVWACAAVVRWRLALRMMPKAPGGTPTPTHRRFRLE